jgi:hypothetical protein
MDEHDQYPTLRELAEGAEDVIEVPAVIVRELFAERDALVAERDHERGLRQGLDRLANTLFEERDGARAERDRLRAAVARYKEFAESEILDRVSAELGVDLRRQLDGSTKATDG